MSTHRFSKYQYHYESTQQTNISADYVDGSSSPWGEWELVRECMQNMMDECDHLAQTQGGHLSDYLHVASIRHDGSDWWSLSDPGRGTDVANILYLGLSGKRGQNYRGEKGEGQLLAFLVAARKGIGIMFRSQDYLLTPRIDRDNGHPHLALDLYRAAKPIQGTVILIQRRPGIDAYIKTRGAFFPDLVKPRGPEKSPSAKKVFKSRTGQSKLYHKGIFVRDIDALFSYNLSESKISRDRDLVSEDDLINEIGQVWNEVTSVPFITRLLQETKSWSSEKLEMRIPRYDLGERQQALWRKVFRELAGHRRAVLWTDDLVAREARRREYVVIKIENKAVFEALWNAGIKRDCDAAQAAEPYEELLPTKKHLALFAIFGDIAQCCNWEDGRTFRVFKPTGADASYDKRLAFRRGNDLYFNRSYLETAPFGDLLSSFIHEEVHRQFNAPDESREFEEGQAELWLSVVKYAAQLVNHYLLTWNAHQDSLIQEAA
jgi:hypothetical protein